MTEQQKKLAAEAREAAKQQNKIQRFVAAGTMKAVTGAFEMVKKTDTILEALDALEAEGKTTITVLYRAKTHSPEDDMYGCNKCGEEFQMNPGHNPVACPGCGREIEATE